MRPAGFGDGCWSDLRIDMYATPEGPVFGEFTAWPRGGSFFTPEANEYLGRMWRGEEGAARPSLW